MGIINRLRDRMGIVLVIVIGLALVSFLLTDFLGQGQFMGGGQDRTVGEIDGVEIDYDMYQRQIEELRREYILRTGTPPTENYMFTLRNQAWDYLIVKHAFGNQYQKAGLTVSAEEQVDMVQGNNIYPAVRQSFTNPETGEFNRNMIVQYLQQLSQDPNAAAQWQVFEKQIIDARSREKFDLLASESLFVPGLQAERYYVEQNRQVDANFLYFPYSSINDSLVSVTTSELEKYIEEHKEEFKTESQRSIRYISVPITPSSSDSVAFFEEMDRVLADFTTTPNDSAYARINSTAPDFFGTYSVGSIPADIKDSSLIEGKIYGPFINDPDYTYYKVSKQVEDTVLSARASHILFRTTGNASEDDSLKREAERILRLARAGGDFAELAQEYSADPSSANGGDLGWFTTGQMVAPFENAVFERSTVGVVNRVVESQFGYHIIKVTEPATPEAYKIAKLTMDIYASDNTRDEAFRKAGKFAASVENFNQFEEEAKLQGLDVRVAAALTANQREIRGLADSREVVRWAFNTEELEKVSDVFELDEAYVVAVLTEIVEEGTSPLDEVRARVQLKVRNEKKAVIIKEKIASIQAETLQEMADAYGTGARVEEATNLRLTAVSVPGIGLAPAAIGAIFALEEGERSEPIDEEGGIIIAEVTAVKEAVAMEDYTASANQKLNQLKQRASFAASEAIREEANIKDQRYKFF